MNTRKSIGVLAVTCGAALACTNLWAATEVHTASIGDLTTTPATEQTNWVTNNNARDGIHFSAPADTVLAPMSIPQFNPALGTLTQVQVVVNGAWEGVLTAQNQASATTNTTVTSGDLEVRFIVDVFNDFDGVFANNSLMEHTGFVFDTNFNATLDTTDVWDNPVLPVVLPPNTTQQDTDVSGAFSGLTITYSTGDAGFANFIGVGNWSLGCGAKSDDNFVTSGGSPLTGHEAFASCDTTITYTFDSEADLGDNPDGSAGTGPGNYNTTAGDGGPSHPITNDGMGTITSPFMGSCVDSDSGTLQNVSADADDLDDGPNQGGTCAGGQDDEDGVTFSNSAIWELGTVQTVTVTMTTASPQSCVVAGWIDFNRDGDFDDVGEKIIDDDTLTNTNTATPYPLNIPLGMGVGPTYARFRCNLAGGLGPIGAAVEGEVEDYRIDFFTNSVPVMGAWGWPLLALMVPMVAVWSSRRMH